MKWKRLCAVAAAAAIALWAAPAAAAAGSGNLRGVVVGQPTLTLEEGVPAEPAEPTHNTVELMLVEGTLLAYLDGEVTATVEDAADAAIVAGMSGGHTLWFTVAGGERRNIALIEEKPVDFTLRGAIRAFATDPTMAAEQVTVAAGSQLGALRLAHDGDAVLWGGVAELSLSNGATAVAHAKIGTARLHGNRCLLVMDYDSTCAVVHTGHPGLNLEANGRVVRVQPL